MFGRLLASLIVLGCTSASDRPAGPVPTPAREEPAKAPVPEAPPTKAAEAAPAVPASPEAAAPSNEPIVGWWCLCYYKLGAEMPVPMTACRARPQDCAALERAVMTGKPGIVFGSVTHSCQETRAAHPGDVYGGRDMWKPSQRAGSWMSVGECRLPGEGKEVDLSARPKEAEEILAKEKLGELRLGLAAAQVIALLGEPGSRGRDQMWEADAAYHQDWSYPQLGLTLDMVSDRHKGDKDIGAITARAPATLATAKGVAIGSPRARVLKLYGKLRDPEFPVDEAEQFIAGSIFGGVMFKFAGGKVTEIFIGAAAE